MKQADLHCKSLLARGEELDVRSCRPAHSVLSYPRSGVKLHHHHRKVHRLNCDFLAGPRSGMIVQQKLMPLSAQSINSIPVAVTEAGTLA